MKTIQFKLPLFDEIFCKYCGRKLTRKISKLHKAGMTCKRVSEKRMNMIIERYVENEISM